MSAPAGWYPDPTVAPGASSSSSAESKSAAPPLRWWDGTAWTEHTHGADGPAAASTGSWQQSGWQQPAPWGRQGGDAPVGSGHGPAAGSSPEEYRVSYDGTIRAKLVATPDGEPFGALGLRLLARIVDSLLVSTVVAVAAFAPLSRVATAFQTYLDQVVTAAQAGATQVPSTQLLADPNVASDLSRVTYITLAVSAVYTILFLRFVGATPGKLLCRLRVRGWDRPGLPTWGQAVLRWVSRDLAGNIPVVGMFYLLLDSLWPLWDRRRQALHDKPGSTVVVRARR